MGRGVFSEMSGLPGVRRWYLGTLRAYLTPSRGAVTNFRHLPLTLNLKNPHSGLGDLCQFSFQCQATFIEYFLLIQMTWKTAVSFFFFFSFFF